MAWIFEGKMSQRLSLRQSQNYMLPSKLVVKLFWTKFDLNLKKTTIVIISYLFGESTIITLKFYV